MDWQKCSCIRRSYLAIESYINNLLFNAWNTDPVGIAQLEPPGGRTDTENEDVRRN